MLAVNVLFAWRLEHELFVMVPSLCRSCETEGVQLLLDLGPQPPSNRFEGADTHQRETHPLIVGQCIDCGLIQLINPMSPAMVKSRFEWLTYNEPESHLDDLVSRLCVLPQIGHDSRIIGLTYKDDSTLTRFNCLGYANTYRYQPAADLALHDRCAGLESIQAALDESMASTLATRHGRADILIIRHVLEHAHDPALLLRAARILVKPAGYLLFEIPGCTKFIRACDYSFLWEEHIVYFSPFTFRMFAKCSNFYLHEIRSYSYALEDSIVAILQPNVQSNAAEKQHGVQQLEAELLAASSFAGRFQEIKFKYRDRLIALRDAGKKVALFGAGHLAAKFLNLFGLKDVVQCVIDDNPHKQGLVMPGSGLPIVGSTAIFDRAVDVCLLSLNPTSEEQVVAKYREFAEHGGQFYSIFPLSPLALFP